jgi:hypothetical protein
MYNRPLVSLAWSMLNELLPGGTHNIEYTNKGMVLKLYASQETFEYVKNRMLIRDKNFQTWNIVRGGNESDFNRRTTKSTY